MSQEELRRAYDSRRILIEASRILSPSFNAQGVYLTGAQIEMLRNITAYLNRRSTWVDTYYEAYYMMADDQDYSDILEMVADLEVRLMAAENTLWGFYESWVENLSFTKVGDGVGITSIAVESEDFIVVLEAVSLMNTTGARGYTQIRVLRGTVATWLAQANALPQSTPIKWEGRITLIPGDVVHIKQSGAISGDVYLGAAWGYKVKVPE